MTNPSIASDLMPCPFCGDSATVSYWGTETQILCTNCNALSAAFSGDGAEQRAIEAWNARIAPEALTREVDKLRAEIKRRDNAKREAGKRELNHFYETTCPCDAAERYVPSCPKHGVALSSSSGRVSDAG